MQIKFGGDCRKAGSRALLRKCLQIWGWHICSSYLILAFGFLLSLFCFSYFDVLHFTPSGLLLGLSTIRPFAHTSSLRPSIGPTSLHPSNQSPFHHPLYSSFDQEVSERSPHTDAASASDISPDPSPGGNGTYPSIAASGKDATLKLPPFAEPFGDTHQTSNSVGKPSESNADSANASSTLAIQQVDPPTRTDGGAKRTISSPDANETFDGPPNPREFVEARTTGESEVIEAESAMFDEHPKRVQGQCNLYKGKWIRDNEGYPLYRSQACPFIDEGFSCQENGRPDDGYLKWRWQPYACNMPRFDAEEMLKMLRGKRLVFVGDSIGRNQWESMLCLLATGAKSKTDIREVNGEPITKHKGFLIFKFESYNCTVEYYRSPFLVPQGRPPSNPPQGVRTTLRVDTIDWTARRWVGADMIVFNTGHWWSYEKTLREGCYFQVGGGVNMNMTVRDGFTKAMRTWRRWVAENIEPSRTRVFFRTYAPVHFSGGTWATGGRCDKEREPFEEEARTMVEEPWTNAGVVAEVARLQRQRHAVHLLNITHLSSFRKDAHCSIYHVRAGLPRPYDRQDCSHWCLPGLPDTWNELLYAALLPRDPADIGSTS